MECWVTLNKNKNYKCQLFFFLTLLSNTVYSVEQDSRDLFQFSIEELGNISITGATLTSKNIYNVPSSVSVFTRKDIRKLGIDHLEELMNYVPGLQAYRQGENGASISYSSRGRKVGSAGKEILILIDGVRIDNRITDGTAITNPLISLNNIERVEFIRGTGSAIYGSNAFLGVINIITVKDQNELQLSGGENDHVQGHLMASKKWDDLEVSLFGQYFQNDGEAYNVQDTFSAARINTQDPVKGSDVNLHARWKKSTLKFMYTERREEDFYMVGRFIDNAINQQRQEQINFALEQQLDWTQKFDSKIKLGYRQLDLDSTVRFTTTQFATSKVEINEYWLAIQNNWQKTDSTSYQFGFEYRRPDHIKADSFVNSSTTSTPSHKLRHQDIFGAYGQIQHKLFKNTDLNLGLRFDHYSSTGSNASPRLALIHNINPDHTLKFIYGEAFRVPTFNELFSTNPVTISNPALQPETVKTWELIWLSQWGNNTLSLGFFDNTFEDSIDVQTIGTTRNFMNATTDQFSQGIEAELIAPLNSEWSLRAGYTFLTDKPSSSFREADSMASLIINYQRTKWNFNISTYYHDEREFLQTGTTAHLPLSDYFVTNTKLKYQFDKDISFFLQAKNLLDESYATPSQAALTEGIPNRGREISAGINWQF
jgi:outer membrane cobalamin receptor